VSGCGQADGPVVARHDVFVMPATAHRGPALRTAAAINRGDLAAEIGRLKQQPGKHIGVQGSPTLVRSLIERDLLDELTLMVRHGRRGSPGRRAAPPSDEPAWRERATRRIPAVRPTPARLSRRR
jgi:dihydrofolate reductase